jgi:hypothetical protein
MGIRHRLRPLGQRRAGDLHQLAGQQLSRRPWRPGQPGHQEHRAHRARDLRKYAARHQGEVQPGSRPIGKAGSWYARDRCMARLVGARHQQAMGGWRRDRLLRGFGTTGWHAAAHCPAANINSTCSPWTASFTSTAPTGRSARSRSPSTARFMTIDRIHVPDWPFGPGKRFCMIINIAVTSIPQRAAPWLPVPCRNDRQPRSCLALGNPHHLIHRRHTCRDG